MSEEARLQILEHTQKQQDQHLSNIDDSLNAIKEELSRGNTAHSTIVAKLDQFATKESLNELDKRFIRIEAMTRSSRNAILLTITAIGTILSILVLWSKLGG